MKEIKNENKKSKLIFDMKITRKLLKMNGEIKYCPYCGRPIEENCECHKNLIIDVKPLRGSDNDASIAVFDNNLKFKEDLTKIMDDIKTKTEIKHESKINDEDVEKLAVDLD